MRNISWIWETLSIVPIQLGRTLGKIRTEVMYSSFLQWTGYNVDFYIHKVDSSIGDNKPGDLY